MSQKFMVFPLGYDPIVASGLPTKDYLDMEINWSEQDVVKAKKLQAMATIIEVESKDELPKGYWTQEII